MTPPYMETRLQAKQSGQRLSRSLKISVALFCVLLVAAVAFYILVLGPARNPLDARSSHLEGGTYTNRAMNLCFTLPAGWTFPDQEDIEALRQAGAQAMDAEIPPAGETGVTLMNAMNLNTGASVQIRCLWNSTPAEDMIEESAELAASIIGGTYEMQRMETVELGGYSYEVVLTRFPEYGVEICQLCGNVRDYLVTIAAAGSVEEAPARFLEAFSALN